MKDWPKGRLKPKAKVFNLLTFVLILDHSWWFGKLVISKICLLDYFGGIKDVNLDEYFVTNPV